MKIYGAFYKRAENENFHMCREDGEAVYLFLHFYNPVSIVLNGETIITKPNAFLIYSPYTRQEYISLEGGFVNDYVKFIPDFDITKKYGLPLNSIFYLDSATNTPDNPSLPQAVDQSLRCNLDFITWALTDTLVNHQAELEKKFHDILCVLATTLKSVVANTEFATNFQILDMKKRLTQLREDIKKSPTTWTVALMAEEVFLTRSHFTTIYTKEFGISPGKELLRMRMALAAKLLRTTDLSIHDISTECGYNNCENFIRGFKKEYGMTPLKYRKQSASSFTD